MKATPSDLVQLAEQLREFLLETGWIEGRRARGVTFFHAPTSLGIEGNYSVAIPDDASKQGGGSLLYGTANSLVELYGYGSLGDLLNQAASLIDRSQPTRITTRFIDGTTRRGAMPLSSLATYVANMEAGLYRSARFKLGVETKETKLVAQRFAKECLFLQTEIGSFIANVEVPHAVLRQADLFGESALVSTEVCSSLFSAIQFINEKILATDDSFESGETLESAISLFDVELLETLTKVVVGPEMEIVEFSLQVGTQIRTSTTGVLSEDKKERLSDFVNFIKDQLRGENDLDVSGAIVELRSRDPEGSRNYIRVVSTYHGDRTYISATLTNEQYQRAVDAHRNKRQVRLKGNGARLKTQIRLTEVTEFIIN